MILIDTNVLSERFKREPNRGVSALFDRETDYAVSVITLDEIAMGLAWHPKPNITLAFERYLNTQPNALPITSDIALRAGELRGRLMRNGHMRYQGDMLIAATALAHRLTLVTRNTKDFEGCGIALLNPFTEDPQ